MIVVGCGSNVRKYHRLAPRAHNTERTSCPAIAKMPGSRLGKPLDSKQMTIYMTPSDSIAESICEYMISATEYIDIRKASYMRPKVI